MNELGKYTEDETATEERMGRQERFRMRRINAPKRSNKRPQQFNGIHRRRRKKIRL